MSCCDCVNGIISHTAKSTIICNCGCHKESLRHIPKLQHSLLPPLALRESVRGMMDGIKDGKYQPWDWLKNPRSWSEYYDKALGHINTSIIGENIANDSGVYHLAHAIDDLLILLEWQIRGLGVDDRPKVPEK